MSQPNNESLTPIDKLTRSLEVVKSRNEKCPINDILLTRLIHFSNRTLEQIYCETLAPEGLLLSHWMVLAMTYGAKDFRRRPQELSAAIGQSGPNTTKTTLFLINKGWIARIPDTENRRSCWMELTDTGKKLIAALLPKMWAATDYGLSPLDETEKLTLINLLTKMLTGKILPCDAKQ